MTTKAKWIGFSALLMIGYAASPACAVDWSTKPHIQRVGPNLVSNPDFTGSTSWSVNNGAAYDAAVSRTAGSGSIRLFDAVAPGFDQFQTAFGSYIPVTGGETYTLSGYSRTASGNGWPSPIISSYYSFRSATGAFLGNPVYSARWGNSKEDEWEEMTQFIKIPETVNGTPVGMVDIQFYVRDAPDGVNRNAWVDDIYFGLGKGFGEAPTPKQGFDGKQTRVDDLGNMEVLKSGTWEPFFPLAIYGDYARPDWNDYSNQGFNMSMRAYVSSDIQKASAAGLLSGIDISPFMIPGQPNYGNTPLLQSRIAGFEQQGLMDDIALFYWDNELAYDQWNVPAAVTDVIKQNNVDGNGDRLHPIYTLNGNLGYARRHQNDLAHLSDITGTYIGGGGRYQTDNFIVLDNIENQRQPNVFAQINRGVGLDLRPRLFGAIAHGARGMGFWKDTYNVANQQVEDEPWWNDFPTIANEIDQMMDAGLIQVPHWTQWSIDTTTDEIDFGTRDLNGEGYLIAVNYADTSSVVTFTLDGLGYTPVEVRDFFTDEVVATLIGNQFDVTLGANSSGVYRLVAPPSNLGDFDGDSDVDGADFLKWQRDESPNGVGSGDLGMWETNFGTSGALRAAAAVPEPSTFTWVLCGGLIRVVCFLRNLEDRK